MKYLLIISAFLFLVLAPTSLAAPGKSGQAPGILKLGPEKIKDILAHMNSDRPATTGSKLNTRRIFVKEATSSAQVKRRAIMGIITALNGNTITLTHQIQKNKIYTVFFDSNTIVKSKSTATSSAALAVGQRIAAVGNLKDGGILAKLIHIIPGLATGVFNHPTTSPSATPVLTPTLTPTITPTASPSATPTPGV